jgi:NitT/TauT family transport system permease protein
MTASTASATELPIAAPGRSMIIEAGRAISLPIAAALAVLALWEFICHFYAIRPVLLPAPSLIFSTMLRTSSILWDNAIPTTVETVGGFVLSAALGFALAVIMLYSKLMRDVLYPNIVVFQLIPKIAVAPLFIMWLGIQWQSRLAIAVFIAFFPIVISTWSGLISTDPSLLRMCRSLGANEWQIFKRVRLPSSLPFVFNGMKISMTFAIIGVIVGEFITSQQGLGYVILFAGSKLETALVMAAILVLCIVGLILYGTVCAVEWLVMRRFGA